MQETQTFDVYSGSGTLIKVRVFEQIDYVAAFGAMLDFTNQRGDADQDEIWLIQHPPVYTQGTACKQSTLLPSDIPVVKTDRGGQITYHGPGQIVMYPLLNLKRFSSQGKRLGVKTLVNALEQCVIDCLAEYSIVSERRDDAPGVYVDGAKVAALGLRIRRGSSYHGLSCNIDMDLSPFSNIDPCGYRGLAVTQLRDLSDREWSINVVGRHLLDRFVGLI